MRHRLQRIAPIWIALVIAPILFTSCAVKKEGTADENPDVISQEEIQDIIGDIGDAYTLVQHYESRWLETRGRGSVNKVSEVSVFIGDSEVGGPSALRQIPVSDVQRVEFLRPAEANMEYGSGHENGAIMVHLKEGKNPRSP